MPKSATLSNPKPGEILLKDFLAPMKLSQNGLARAVSAPPRRIKEIVFGKRAIAADTDLRLAGYFGLSDGFWLGIQSDYELMESQISDELERIAPRAMPQ